MQRNVNWVHLCALALLLAASQACGAATHPAALQTPPPERLIQSKNWRDREAAFDQIWRGLQINHQAGGCGDLNGGASPAVRSAVTRLLAMEADSQEAAEKNISTLNEQDWGEDRSEFFASLIQSTECLHDPGSVDVLLRPVVLDTGMMAIRGIAFFGDVAFPKVWARYRTEKDAVEKDTYLTVLRTMLVEHSVKDPRAIHRLEEIFLAMGRSPNYEDRSDAIPALAAMTDPRGRAELIQIATSDPEIDKPGPYAPHPDVITYPLRDLARNALIGSYVPPR